MSSLVRRIVPSLTARILRRDARDLARWAVEIRRRRRREPHRLFYFHQVDDPYSHLVAQVLERVLARYDVVLEARLVGPPPDEAAPERALLEAYARKDATDIASGYGLAFGPVAPSPAAEDVALAQHILPVLRQKRLYILLDTKREAKDAGVDFGRVCDPVGRPVERGYSLYPLAKREGREAEYLESFARAAWAEGIGTGEDAGLRRVCERAGLAWEDAEGFLDRAGWESEFEANREQMFGLGLWGVPSFRLLGDGRGSAFCTWGRIGSGGSSRRSVGEWAHPRIELRVPIRDTARGHLGLDSPARFAARPLCAAAPLEEPP